MESASTSVSTLNIRPFKEAVANTSRLLKLSRVRGLMEDLEARTAELRQAVPAVVHSAPPTSPSAAVVEENGRLKRELESK
ncbi:hypothetical protein IWQ56_006740 [Coemansia nantahalensis]|nr:hypothetical protein IWQ56_006740 [Coemansia nantahalensis]